jgi:uncharacterized membrane protein
MTVIPLLGSKLDVLPMIRATAPTIGISLAVVVLLSVFVAPAAAQPDANISVEASEVTVTPGEEITLTYTLQNTGDNASSVTSVSIESMPGTDWTVSSDSGDWQDNTTTWLSLSSIDPGGEYVVAATVTVPENASEGEYDIAGEGFVTPDVGDAANLTITVREPQPVADLSASVSDTNPRPGDEVTLSYTLSNTGDVTGSSTAVDITSSAGALDLDSNESDWLADQGTWVNTGILAPGEQYQAGGTITIPETASEGEYEINATGNVAPEVSDSASLTLTVEEFSTSNYDSDGDGSVEGDTTGVVKALADYNEQKLGFQEILQVIATYNG